MITLSTLNLDSEKEVRELSLFLESLGINLEKDIDYCVIYKKNDRILASASKSKNILKCFGISHELQGENITALLLTDLVNKLIDESIFHYFLLTKRDKEDVFTSLGFKFLYRGELSSLLENGIYSISDSLDKMGKDYNICGENGAIVLNCNPFTKGHRYLIEEASKDNKNLILFIVSEDKSIFPFKDRIEIIKDGVRDLKNVKVIPGGEYIISGASFPSYFLKRKEDKVLSEAQIDAGIFGKYFCPKFNIKDRYVGEEPADYVTQEYNKALDRELSKFSVKLHIIKRMEINKEIISASKVRSLIKEGKIFDAWEYLPESTVNYLKSPKGLEIIKKIVGI